MSYTMWWLLVILFVATAAATEDEDVGVSCMGRVFAECPNHDEEPKDIPETEEEFQKFCKYARTYFGCVRNILDNCSEDGEYEEIFLEFGSNILRVCEEDSLIYDALVESLPCIKSSVDDIESCPASFGDIDSFDELLAGLGDTDLQTSITSIPEPNKCMKVLYAVGCMAATVGKNCGDVARSVVVNFFEGFNAPYKVCPEGVQEYIADIATAMQAEEEKRQAVENKLKRKK